MIERDVDRYATLLRSLASLSGLFSNNSAAYVDSRFVEKLFVETSGGTDLGRFDKSFDALVGNDIGVGIKTFLGGSGASKREKIAEFTSLARLNHFNTTNKKMLVTRVAEARNVRVLSDANELGIDVAKSYYHCLIRINGGAVVHEEPYGLIDLEALRPTDRAGKIVKSWDAMGGGIYFTDGTSFYSFNVSKNVLLKKFSFDRKKNFIPLEIHPDPLQLLQNLEGSSSMLAKIETTVFSRKPDQFDELIRGVDYVVLPLYSPGSKKLKVPEKSGINQWRAAGRKRKFGEAYISVPREIHNRYPKFFPDQENHFDLLLPNNQSPLSAKICQAGGKALMTKKNFELGRWLIEVIDPSTRGMDFSMISTSREPYKYEDLLDIEKDSVVIRRELHNGKTVYRAMFAPVGSYEEFLDE